MGALALALAAPPALTSGQEPARHFSHLGAREGLSQASVMAMAQDSLGFMWIGTQDGLNRFDGHGFRVHRIEPGHPESLRNAYVNDLVVDGAGSLWVATFGGLHRYDNASGAFVHVPAPERLPSRGDIVRALHLSDDGALWAGTVSGITRLDPATGEGRAFPVEDGGIGVDVRTLVVGADGLVWFGTGEGLRILDPVSGTVRPYVAADGRAPVPDGTFVWRLYRDRQGTLWVGTGGQGLVEIHPDDGAYRAHRSVPDDPASLPGDDVRALHDDGEHLWVGTMTGLGALDRQTGRVERFVHDPLDSRSLRQDAVWAIQESRDGLLWFGTAITGVSVHDPLTRQFEHYRGDPVGGDGLSHSVVYGILGDGQGTIWLGTREGGLNRWDRATGAVTALRHDPADPSTLSADYVNALALTPDGAVWAGTYDAGLNRVDPATGRVTRLRHRPGDPASIGSNRIRALAVDRGGDLWIGLSGDGLDRLDPATGTFTRYRHDPDDPTSLSGGFVRGLLVDGGGDLWVVMYGTGVNRFDAASGTFRRFRHDPSDPESLGSDFVRSAFQDSTGRYWFATDTGLNLLVDEARGRFRRYGVADGLPNPVVYGVLEDDAGRLWVSTNEGLARLDPETDEVVTFDVADGLQENEFNTGAFFRDDEGRMYFGGVGGLTVFDPGRVRSPPPPSAVVLTEFRLFNEPVPVADTSVLVVEPPQLTAMTLRPQDQVFSFGFTALEFRRPERIHYEYRLDGLHDGWIRTAADNRRATFTSLAPGTYTFRVRAGGPGGAWNESGPAVELTVLPTFWETGWFRAGAGLLLLAALGGAVLARQRSLERRNAWLEERVAERLVHIKRLEGLLPICSSCKKIRVTDDHPEDRDGWVPIESYISGRTDADFSHGICPDCSNVLLAEADHGE